MAVIDPAEWRRLAAAEAIEILHYPMHRAGISLTRQESTIVEKLMTEVFVL